MWGKPRNKKISSDVQNSRETELQFCMDICLGVGLLYHMTWSLILWRCDIRRFLHLGHLTHSRVEVGLAIKSRDLINVLT